MDKEPADRQLFTRNIGTLTQLQQHKLRTANVTVIGCGGLGGYVIEELARSGVGQLNICDPDCFTASNINRQLNALQSTIGVNKAQAALERVSFIHTMTLINSFPVCFQKASADLFNQADVVIDCLDSAPERVELADLCLAKKLPLVHGAVVGWYGQVGVQTTGSPLVRKLYSSTDKDKVSTLSVLSCSVALVASLQVAETIKLLVGIPSSLLDNWLSIDLQRMTFETIITSK
jgi:molybdopterin/thiamine biosynthesis adenylyltransferase